jgi:hypothetical protein
MMHVPELTTGDPAGCTPDDTFEGVPQALFLPANA